MLLEAFVSQRREGSLPVWRPGPVFLLGGGSMSLVPCSFQGVFVSGPVFLLAVSLQGVSVQRQTQRQIPPGQRPPLYRDPMYKDPSGQRCPSGQWPPRRRPPGTGPRDRASPPSRFGGERVMGILLECILVYYNNHINDWDTNLEVMYCWPWLCCCCILFLKVHFSVVVFPGFVLEQCWPRSSFPFSIFQLC